MAELRAKSDTNGEHPPTLQNANNLVEIRGLKMHFTISEGLISRAVGTTKAVDDVSFDIRAGETLGLVGESGCGKTTVGRCIVRAYQPTAGSILYNNAVHQQDATHKQVLPGHSLKRAGTAHSDQVVDLAALSSRVLKPYHHEVRMIFQDPYSSLNPRITVFE